MSKQRVNRQAGLKMRIKTKVETIQHMDATLLREAVATISIDNVSPIRVERSDCKLVAQQVEIPGSEVEQRADAGIGLAIVVTQVAFVVSSQSGNSPIKEGLPAVRESPIQFELQRLVLAHSIREAVRLAVRRHKCIAGVWVNARCSKTDSLGRRVLEEVVRLRQPAKQGRVAT